MRMFAVAAVFLVGVGTAWAQTDPMLVSPGVGIGPITVGMGIQDVTRLMGIPEPAQTILQSVILPVPNGATIYAWPLQNPPTGYVQAQGMSVATNSSGVVYEVRGPFDPRYHTPEGIHIGSSERDVTKAYGTPSRAPVAGSNKFDVYDARGLAVEVENDHQYTNYGQVNGLWVFAPQV